MRALPLGPEVETGRKHDRRLGKEGTFLFRCAFYPDGQKNGSKRRRLAAEPKIEPCQEIRTSRKQHVLTADQWRNVRNKRRRRKIPSKVRNEIAKFWCPSVGSRSRSTGANGPPRYLAADSLDCRVPSHHQKMLFAAHLSRSDRFQIFNHGTISRAAAAISIFSGNASSLAPAAMWPPGSP